MLIAACSVILSWVALFNSFPLVFPDTLSYATTAILGEIPGMFSAYYSPFIMPLHQGVTLWPVVFVQGAIVSHLVYLVVRCASGGDIGKLATLLIVGALSLFSSLPWLTGQLMPDVFTPVVFLGVFLLAFCTRRLARPELIDPHVTEQPPEARKASAAKRRLTAVAIIPRRGRPYRP